MGKLLIGAGVAVGMMSSTVAMAATRSSQALPSVRTPALPTQGLRNSTQIKRKSAQAEDGTSTYIVGGLAAAAVIGGIVVVASDNGNNPSSPG